MIRILITLILAATTFLVSCEKSCEGGHCILSPATPNAPTDEPPPPPVKTFPDYYFNAEINGDIIDFVYPGENYFDNDPKWTTAYGNLGFYGGTSGCHTGTGFCYNFIAVLTGPQPDTQIPEVFGINRTINDADVIVTSFVPNDGKGTMMTFKILEIQHHTSTTRGYIKGEFEGTAVEFLANGGPGTPETIVPVKGRFFLPEELL